MTYETVSTAADERRYARALETERRSVLAEINMIRATVPRPPIVHRQRERRNRPLSWKDATLAWLSCPAPRPSLDIFAGPDAIAAAAHRMRIARRDAGRSPVLRSDRRRFRLSDESDRGDLVAMGPHGILVSASQVTPLAPVGRSARRRRVFRSAPVRYLSTRPTLLIPGHRPMTVDRVADRGAGMADVLASVDPAVAVRSMWQLCGQVWSGGSSAAADGLWLTAPREPSSRRECTGCGAPLPQRGRCDCWMTGTAELSRAERQRRRIARMIDADAELAPVATVWTLDGGLVPRRALRSMPTAALPPTIVVECRSCGTEFRRERRNGRPTVYCPTCRASGRRVRNR